VERFRELSEQKDRSPSALRRQIENLNPDQRKAVTEVVFLRLSEMTGENSDDEAGALLELLRAMDSVGTTLPSTAFMELLSARSRIYQGRPKPEILRLRSFILLTAAMSGCGSEIIGLVIENLSNGVMPYVLACAARAARFGPKHELVLKALEPHVLGLHDDVIVSLDRYQQQFPAAERTSAHLEILRTVGHYGPEAFQLRIPLQSCIDRLQSLRITPPLPLLKVALESLSEIGP